MKKITSNESCTISECGSRSTPLRPNDLRFDIRPAALSVSRRTRIAVPTLVLLALALLAPAAAAPQNDFEVIFVQEEQLQPPVRRPIDPLDLPRLHSNESSRGKLFDHWFLLHAARPGEDAEEADRLFRDLVLTFKKEGFQSEPRVAGAFMYEGQQMLEAGENETALELFHKALFLDPASGPARAGMSRALRRTGDWWGAVEWGTRSLPLTTGDWSGTVPLVANMGLVVGFGLLLGLTVVVVLSVLRHFGRGRHDLEEWIARFTGRDLAAVAATAGMLLPAFLWQGPAWLLAFLLVFLFPYFGRSERLLAALALVGLLVTPAAARMLQEYDAFWWDARVEEVLALAEGGYARESVEAVAGQIEAGAPPTDLQAILAQAYSDGGFSNEAYAQYRTILDARPDAAWVFNNLGNLYLRSQQYGVAMQNYRKAMETDPGMVEPYYNLHIAHLEQFQIEEAEEMLRQSQMLAPERTSQWVEEGKKYPWMAGVLLPVDIRVPRRQLIAETARRRTASDPAAPASKFVTWWQGPAIAGGLGLIGLVIGMGLRRTPVAERCRQCSRVYCRRCQKERLRSLCAACHHLQARKEALSARNLAAKTEEIARVEARGRRLRRLANLVFPGSGHLIGGRSLAGAVLVLTWSTAAVALFTRPLRIPAIEVPYASASPLAVIVLSGLLALVWLSANLGANRAQVGRDGR